jgi:uncharacterized protein
MDIFNRIFLDLMARLETGLPDFLTYHNAAHTRYVIKKAEEIAEAEGIADEKVTLIKIAALFHDCGFLKERAEHERVSCEMVSEELPKYGFDKEKINQIRGMIMATKIPQIPTNLLESVVADADLEYLGTDLYDFGAQNLFSELRYFNPELTLRDWLLIQIRFLESHQFHTNHCRKYREPRKQEHLEQLKRKLSNQESGRFDH